MSWATETTSWGETIPGWKPGQTTVRVTGDVAVCPNCGIPLTHNGHGRGRDGVQTRATTAICGKCNHREKLLRPRLARVTLLG